MSHRITKILRCSGSEPVSEDDGNMRQNSEDFGVFRYLTEEPSFDQMRGSTPDYRLPRLYDEDELFVSQSSCTRRPHRPCYPPIFVEPANIVRSYEKSKRIGLSGGTMALAGFAVEISTQTERAQHRMKLKLKFFDAREDEGNWTFFGPEVDFEPNGITFSQPVLMTIPTCYVTVYSLIMATVKIQSKVNGSWEDSDRSNIVDRKINFSLREFTPLRFLMRKGFFEKTIAYMLYIRQGEDECEVILCFCDDLMETTLEAEKQMELRDFTSSEKSGTFLMRHNNVVKLVLKIPDCDIEDPTRTIPARNLWASDVVVKVEFNIKNLGDGVNTKDMTGQITIGENEIIVL